MPENAGSDMMTADELLRVEVPGKLTELVRGRLVVREPPGARHGQLSARLTYRLGAFVYKDRLGEIFAQDTGFRIAFNPDTVRAPDVAFVRTERMDQAAGSGYAAMAPDLVVEVVSEHDRPGELLAKVADWLQAGALLVWVVDPWRNSARVYRGDGSQDVLDEDGVLDGEDVVPGFRCPLRELLR